MVAQRPAQVDVVGVQRLDAGHDGNVVEAVGRPQAAARLDGYLRLEGVEIGERLTEGGGHGHSDGYKNAPESEDSRGAGGASDWAGGAKRSTRRTRRSEWWKILPLRRRRSMLDSTTGGLPREQYSAGGLSTPHRRAHDGSTATTGPPPGRQLPIVYFGKFRRHQSRTWGRC